MISVLTTESEIEDAQARLVTAFDTRASDVEEIRIGFPGGTMTCRAFWIRELNLWASFDRAPSRYWNAFGLGNPIRSATPNPITVEVNSPYVGVARGIQGAFGRDSQGNTYLLHRGKIGGNTQRIDRATFLDRYGRFAAVHPVADVDREGEVVVVGHIESDEFLEQLAAFVSYVADFKLRVREGAVEKADSENRNRGYRSEFSGSRNVPPREAVTADCRHGIIVDTLRKALLDEGLSAWNDQLRDLVVGSNGTAAAVFEVKSSSDRYSVYTAVGQLTLHAVRDFDCERVAVLPVEGDPLLRELVNEAGFRTLLFEWDGRKPVFSHGFAEAVTAIRARRSGA